MWCRGEHDHRVRHRPRQRALGAHTCSFEQSLPICRGRDDRRDRQRLLEPGTIIENERISANREGYLGTSTGDLDANRRARFIRTGWSAARLLNLEQLHSRRPERLPELDVKGLAAAAATLLVWIAEGEAALQLLFDIIHLGPEDEHDRLRIDQYRHPLVLDDFVVFTLLIGIFERVAEPGAAAGPHADPHADRRLAALGEQRLYALCRRIG